MRPAMIFSSVVLPQPLGPSTTIVRPSGIRSVRSSMANVARCRLPGSASFSVLPTATRSMRAMRAAALADQAVEPPGVLARHLVRDVVGQVLELLADVLRRLRPHAVGVRVVGAPHQRLHAHLVDELGAYAVVLERRLGLPPPVLARLQLERQVLVLVLVLEVHAVEHVGDPADAGLAEGD